MMCSSSDVWRRDSEPRAHSSRPTADPEIQRMPGGYSNLWRRGEGEGERAKRKERGRWRRGEGVILHVLVKPVLFPGFCAPKFPFLTVLQVTERWVGLWAGL